MVALLRSLVTPVGIACVACSLCLACGSDTEAQPGGVDNDASDARSESLTTADVLLLHDTASDRTSGYCSGSGPPVDLPTLGGCTGDLAMKTFTFAICSCSGYAFVGSLTTDSFDANHKYDSLGGSVGTNGFFNGKSSVGGTIGGSLWASGEVSLQNENVLSDVHCGGLLSGSSHISGDAYARGGASAGIVIDGQLHTEPGSVQTAQAKGGVVVETVPVPEPCNCNKPADIQAIVDYIRVHNDNALVGLSTDSLSKPSVDEITLPCGRYYVDALTGDHTIHLSGRTAIAVGGGAKGLKFDLGADAELDLFIASDVQLGAGSVIGSPQKPGASRVYVGGSFNFSGVTSLAGNFYVPKGLFHGVTDVHATKAIEVSGAVFANEVGFAGNLIVHYDQSVLSLLGCDAPQKECSSCRDCANPNPACKNGACNPCETSHDCCPPLTCIAGACVPVIK